MKKILAFILTLLFVVSTFSVFTVSAATVEMENYFTDVVVNSWYEDGVLYCYKYGYMSGVGEAVFNPNGNCTRAMFATVLYNISMATDTYSKMSFKDVPLNTWYSNPVEWAYKNEYTYGVAEGYFGPNNNLSRQELVTLLYRYHLANNEDVTVTGNVTLFKDAASVSDWAEESLNWAIGEGIISGFEDSTLRPKGLVTRAQLASILKRYLEVYGIDWVNETIQEKRTCTTDGVSVFYDSTGNLSKTVVYKAWHKFLKDKVVQKYDCVYGEKTRYICSICGETKTELTRKGTGKHNWNNGKVTEEPTVYYDGEKLFTCKTCGGTYTKIIPKLIVSKDMVKNWYSELAIDGDNRYTLLYPVLMTIKSDGQVIIRQAGNTFKFTCQYYGSKNNFDYYYVMDKDGNIYYILTYDNAYFDSSLTDGDGVSIYFSDFDSFT